MTMQNAGVSSRSQMAIRVMWIAAFALLTGVAALVRIPLGFTPVPLTLQTLVVLASGIILGRDGKYAQGLYLLLGGIGLPMFAGPLTGFPFLFGPTGGYLVGFVLAAWMAGHLLAPRWNQSSFAQRFLGAALVSLVVFVPGLFQLAFFAGLNLSSALLLGFVPFVPGLVLKALAVASLKRRSV